LITLAYRAEASAKAGARDYRLRTFKKLSLSPAHPARFRNPPGELLPKIPAIRQEKNSKNNVALSKALFSLSPLPRL
jgi:hypothetical protein